MVQFGRNCGFKKKCNCRFKELNRVVLRVYYYCKTEKCVQFKCLRNIRICSDRKLIATIHR